MWYHTPPAVVQHQKGPCLIHRAHGSTANTILTRDGTAEPISRDQILRRKRGQGNIHFFLFICSRAGLATLPGRSILLLYVMTIHKYILLCVVSNNKIRLNQFPPSDFRPQIRAKIAPISARILVENRSEEISDRKLPISAIFLPSGNR